MRQLIHQLVVFEDLPYFLMNFSQIIITKRILRSGPLYISMKIASKSNQFLSTQNCLEFWIWKESSPWMDSYQS